MSVNELAAELLAVLNGVKPISNSLISLLLISIASTVVVVVIFSVSWQVHIQEQTRRAAIQEAARIQAEREEEMRYRARNRRVAFTFSLIAVAIIVVFVLVQFGR